jgi:hypothetical protein
LAIFFYNGIFKTRDSIIQDTGCNFNLVTFFRLRTAILHFTATFKIQKGSDGSSTGMDSFFNRDRKGSKYLRKIINNPRLDDKLISKLTTVKSHFKLAGITVPEPALLKNILSFWLKQYIPCRIGEFLFKFNSNCLGLNARVAHFVVDHDAACTFCTLRKDLPVPRECFLHLFINCPYTNKIIDQICTRHFPGKFNSEIEKKGFFISGLYIVGGERKWCEFAALFSVVFRYLIWECKLSKTCKVFALFESDLFYHIQSALRLSKTLLTNKVSFEARLGINLAWARG